jgi:hypothetical protein
MLERLLERLAQALDSRSIPYTAVLSDLERGSA